ncbi:MAG TPA: S41 family peptidase [Candidatus Cybelea sp.]|nr:S41 family peptidase [Candidatus Cybelea sp.]
MRNFFLGAVSAIALMGTVAVLTVPGAGGLMAASSETYRQLNLFGDVFERIRNDYVEPVNDGEMIEAAINGMLASLDPHSSYMNQKAYREMQVQTRGEFGGLGIEVTMENGLVKVVSPIDDTPAAKAGLLPGDFITQLDGQQVMGLTLQEAVEKMRGPTNSKITLTIQRVGKEKPFDVVLTRAQIKVQSVRGRREGNVGYVRITSFNEQTDSGLQKTVAELKKEIGNDLQGWVIDLRNNPGGLLDQAIGVSDDFLERGEIVSTRGRRSEDAQRFNARPGDITDGKPLVVLINGGSASASEIVAGALQDHHRAVLLGTRSFGKGSVQTIIPLQGYGALRLTTARYYTPSGRSIQAEGIKPDIVVPPAKIEPLEEPQRRSEADLRGHLQNDGGENASGAQKPADQSAPGEAKPSGAGGDQSKAGAAAPADTAANDYQLQRALDLLRGVSLFSAKAGN